MSERDQDRADLDKAREAVVAAETASVKTDVAVASLQRANAEITSIVEPNGYVTRFRLLLRGA